MATGILYVCVNCCKLRLEHLDCVGNYSSVNKGQVLHVRFLSILRFVFCQGKDALDRSMVDDRLIMNDDNCLKCRCSSDGFYSTIRHWPPKYIPASVRKNIYIVDEVPKSFCQFLCSY